MIQLTLGKPGFLRVDAPAIDAARLRTVPGIRADARSEPPYWTVPATLYHGVLLRNLFGEEMQYDDEVRRFFAGERRQERSKLDPDPHPDPRLFPFQKKGAGRLCIPGGAMLADEVGTGKTVQALTALSTLGAEALPALVVTTRTMKMRWAAEAAIWCPEAVPYVVTGTAPQRKKVLAEAAQDPRALVCINWESLRNHSRLANYPGQEMSEKDMQPKELNSISFRTVIADESHRAKDPHAKQTRALWQVGRGATWRWALTGTPIGNDYVDLWSQLRFIAPEEFPVRGAWLDRYVLSIFNGFTEEPMFLRPETKDELFWWLDSHMLRRTIAELPELRSEIPRVQEIRLDIELTPKQATAYRQMKKEMMTRIDDELLAVTDPFVKVGKLRYIASALPLVEGGEVVALQEPSNKITSMLELLEDRELRPAVVFAESSKLINLAAEVTAKEGYRVGAITGEQPDNIRNQQIQEFQDGELDVMFCTSAGGEGITLTAGASMIFLQTPRSLIMYKQMLGRVPRIGNKRSLIPAYHLVSLKTNDEAVFDLIVTKSLRLEDIVRDKQRLLGSL